MKRFILRNFQSPGDILMLTAALRDLHLGAPEPIETDVRTPCPDLWENNPWITPMKEEEPGVETIDCHYPLIHESNRVPRHFLHGFIEFLNEELGLRVKLSQLSGDIHLSRAEMEMPSMVQTLTGVNAPFWILVAGGKYDFTIKWWHHERFQEVVDHFRGRLLFVQVGENGHFHPKLSGVLDLRGKTTLRDLARLVWNADGVVCPVTFLMHLAAAVPVRAGLATATRPCVVIAGGREPATWEAYAGHDYLHTIGRLPCCATGGCWKSRTVPLGDGDDKDQSLCVDVVNNLPHCMDLITSRQVIEAVNRHLLSGQSRTLSAVQVDHLRRHLTLSEREEMMGIAGWRSAR